MQTLADSRRFAADPPPPDAVDAVPSSPVRRCYLGLLAWAFAVCNVARVVAYLPNIVAIRAEGDSMQHSLLTWVVLCVSNLTMAAWLHERNGRRFDRAGAVSVGNAAMCLATAATIAWYRF